MGKRVEGRIALKFHDIDNAAVAALSLAVALDDFKDTYEDGNIEVVQVDLVQVETPDEDPWGFDIIGTEPPF